VASEFAESRVNDEIEKGIAAIRPVTA
jgi:hypothetical protein